MTSSAGSGGLAGRKLLILGGNPETGALVDFATGLGIHTVVVDPNPDAPAKRRATEQYEIDGFDVAGIARLARDLQVDGVLVGVADVLVRPYSEVCAELGLPCYTPESAVAAFSSKDGYRAACALFEVNDIPGVVVDRNEMTEQLRGLTFPVMVKPVDSGGGLGMQICADVEELKVGMQAAFAHSRTGRILIERYMQCDDMLAYYTFVDGEVFLSATADRFTTRVQSGASPVCIAARYPSQHTHEFVEHVHPQLVRMFEGLGVRNGILNLQFFVDGDDFYSYDPGFRLQGEAPHIYLAAVNGFDHRAMLLHFALTGSVGVDDFERRNDYMLQGKHACTLWVLLNSGVIDRIDGLDTIRHDPNVVLVLQRLREGDVVSPEMTGTERQVLARIYTVADSAAVLADKAREFREVLTVADRQGNDMIIDWIDPTVLGEAN